MLRTSPSLVTSPSHRLVHLTRLPTLKPLKLPVMPNMLAMLNIMRIRMMSSFLLLLNALATFTLHLFFSLTLFIHAVFPDGLQPRVKLDVLYSVAHSVTYMTASFLKVASFSLSPSSLKSLFPPPPFIPPMRWAPGLLFHAPRHRSFGSASLSNGCSRRRASSKAFAVSRILLLAVATPCSRKCSSRDELRAS